ncbi:ubiquitin-conjugating enzyme E2 [Yasminevirus sp. GU-2018]|uniref:E2 ubiquitin-conjugating enzyme n=1 Tax=Yasminevirus sp. GU-2018 TaxID=2420051 RepID=A0A5K0U7P8_9VIRU|nr:ubiquitin-conjugating enzyme E2 [Yasminevirus sp. GU-2018]
MSKIAKSSDEDTLLEIGTHKFIIKHEGGYFVVYSNTPATYAWLDKINCRSMIKKLSKDAISTLVKESINGKSKATKTTPPGAKVGASLGHGNTESSTNVVQTDTVDDVDIRCIREATRVKGLVQSSIQNTPYASLDVKGRNATVQIQHFTLKDRLRCSEIVLTDYINLYKVLVSGRLGLTGSLSLKNDCIYDWRVVLDYDFNKSDGSPQKSCQDIVIDFRLHPDLHPNSPPSVQVVSPRFDNDLNARISRSKFTMLEYWDCDRTVIDITVRVADLIKKYGKITTPLHKAVTPNSKLSQSTLVLINEVSVHLTSIASLCDVDDDDDIDRDQKFIKINDLIESKRVKKKTKNQNDGTGYGHDKSSVWDPNEYHNLLKEKNNRFITLMNSIIFKINRIMDIEKGDISFTVDMIKESTLYKFFIKRFKHISILEITNEANYYRSMFTLIQLYCLDNTVHMFYDKDPDKALYTRICELKDKATACLDIDSTNENANMIYVIHSMIETPYEKYVQSIKDSCIKEQNTATPTTEKSKTISSSVKKVKDVDDEPKNTSTEVVIKMNERQNAKQIYAEKMKQYRYKIVPGLAESGSYHYEGKASAEDFTAMKQCYKRLSSEIPALIESMSVAENGLVIVNIDKKRPNCIRYMLNGPVGTPYARGLFIFDSYCGPNYPNTAPDFHFMNTGGFRFNPNLYGEGKVCLSLLGTYSGPDPHESEKWNPKLSTLSQVIISIQAQIFVDHPYFNEPGHERYRGKPEGDRESRDYNENVRLYTMKAGMLDLIQHRETYPQFSNAILTHFALQKNNIIEQCKVWINECRSEYTKADMEKTFALLQGALTDLTID